MYDFINPNEYVKRYGSAIAGDSALAKKLMSLYVDTKLGISDREKIMHAESLFDEIEKIVEQFIRYENQLDKDDAGYIPDINSW